MALSDRRRRLLQRLHVRKTREREGRVLVEGVRAVTEALRAGAAAHLLLVSPRGREVWTPSLQGAVANAGVPVDEVTDEEMARVAGTETPQGVLLVAAEPPLSLEASLAGPGGRILVLDGVRDPGNVGTLIRVAAAFACSAVAALDGTADPWGSRAVRAAVGTTFRLPVLQVGWEEAEEWLAGTGARGRALWVADAGGRPVGGPEDDRSAWALAVGSEAAGCRPEVASAASGAVGVPMPGGVESLNVGVAGAILLYELTRELTRAR